MNYTQLLHNIMTNPVILISLIVIIFFKIYPPKKINSWYGYRTIKSQKSEKNWHFAQRYSATITLPLNIILFLVQIALYVLIGSTAYVDLGIIGIWILGMAICIYKVEQKLKEI